MRLSHTCNLKPFDQARDTHDGGGAGGGHGPGDGDAVLGPGLGVAQARVTGGAVLNADARPGHVVDHIGLDQAVVAVDQDNAPLVHARLREIRGSVRAHDAVVKECDTEPTDTRHSLIDARRRLIRITSCGLRNDENSQSRKILCVRVREGWVGGGISWIPSL